MSTQKLVRQIKLNNLQHNALRDSAVCRRCANEPFRIQALFGGTGQARGIRCKITGFTPSLLFPGQQSPCCSTSCRFRFG